MLAKIYWYIWLAIATAFALIVVIARMSDLTIVVFGLIAFGMTFTGMMNILPSTIAHSAPETETIDTRSTVKPSLATSIQHGVRSIRV